MHHGNESRLAFGWSQAYLSAVLRETLREEKRGRPFLTKVPEREDRSWYFHPMRHLLPIIAGAALLASCTAPEIPFDEAAAIQRGQGIAKATFEQLFAQVKAKMESEGPTGAVDHCSVAALPLVDSLSMVQGVRIKRTSDRLRAPHDAPDADEQRRLDEVLAMLGDGAKPTEIPAQALLLGDSIAYYQPILINMPNCLKCHGTPGAEVDAATMAVLAEKYPADAATGYAVGDFRGLWSIRWKR
jgi:hypothetical protein